MSLQHGFPPGNTKMSHLDREFFILKTHIDAIERMVNTGDADVHPDTVHHVLFLISSMNNIHDKLANNT